MIGDFNLLATIGFVIRLLAIGIILFLVLPRAIIELLRPHDWLTGLRWRLLGVFVFTILASVPSVIYQILLVYGIQSDILRAVITITGNLSFLGFAVLVLMIYNYRRKE